MVITCLRLPRRQFAGFIFLIIAVSIIARLMFNLEDQADFADTVTLTLETKWHTDGATTYTNPHNNIPAADVTVEDAINYEMFKPTLTEAQRETLMTTFADGIKIFRQLNFQPFLFAGSLLGFVRHNRSVIPWDTDIDIGLLATSGPPERFIQQLIPRLRAAANTMGYTATPNLPSHIIRFYAMDNRTTKLEEDTHEIIGFPTLDVAVLTAYSFQADQEHFDRSGKSSVFFKWIRNSYWYPYEVTMPLQLVKFENVEVYAPRNPLAWVEIEFDRWNVCVNNRCPICHRHNRELHKLDCTLLIGKT